VAWSLRALVTGTLFIFFARRASGFAYRPWPDNMRDYLLTLAALVLPVTITDLVTTSPIARIGVAAASVAIYFILILTRVLTGEERTALQKMLPLRDRA